MNTAQPVVHWRRPLKDGGVEFHFEARGQKLTGSVTPARHVRALFDAFERYVGVQLPAAEVRPMRHHDQEDTA